MICIFSGKLCPSFLEFLYYLCLVLNGPSNIMHRYIFIVPFSLNSQCCLSRLFWIFLHLLFSFLYVIFLPLYSIYVNCFTTSQGILPHIENRVSTTPTPSPPPCQHPDLWAAFSLCFQEWLLLCISALVFLCHVFLGLSLFIFPCGFWLLCLCSPLTLLFIL